MSVRSDDAIRNLRFRATEIPLLSARPSIKWIVAITVVASLVLAAIGVRIGPELRMRPDLSTAGAATDPEQLEAADRHELAAMIDHPVDSALIRGLRDDAN